MRSDLFGHIQWTMSTNLPTPPPIDWSVQAKWIDGCLQEKEEPLPGMGDCRLHKVWMGGGWPSQGHSAILLPPPGGFIGGKTSCIQCQTWCIGRRRNLPRPHILEVWVFSHTSCGYGYMSFFAPSTTGQLDAGS